MLPVSPICPIGMLHRWGLPSLFISERTGSGLASKSRSRRDQTSHTSYILGLRLLWLMQVTSTTSGSVTFRPHLWPPFATLPLCTRTALCSADFVWKVSDSDWKVHKHEEPSFTGLIHWIQWGTPLALLIELVYRTVFLTLICFSFLECQSLVNGYYLLNKVVFCPTSCVIWSCLFIFE